MSEPDKSQPPSCICTQETDSSTAESELERVCNCPTDKHGIVIHQEECLLFKHETFVFPEEICECGIGKEGKKIKGIPCECDDREGVPQVNGIPCECDLPKDVILARHLCSCKPPEASDEWSTDRDTVAMPAVLESTHPLMQRFQLTLREFLLKENAIAEEKINNLKDDLRLSKLAYESDLEKIYTHDHNCNDQRKLIEEYEATTPERAAARHASEQRAKIAFEKQKQVREQLDKDLIAEQESREEMENLTNLCSQLEKWREETQSELTVSQRVSDKIRIEKRLLTDEKREMDIMVFGLTNEVWKLESKLEMLKKQMEVKSYEMDNINNKVTAYGAELEDLELDKRRLVTLWRGVLVNISQRDSIYCSVKNDYRELQQHFQTLIANLEVTKKAIAEEIRQGKELAMNKDKIIYDTSKAAHLLKNEDAKRIALETQIVEMNESIELNNKDQELMKAENFIKSNILKSTEKDMHHKINKKRKLDSEILANIQDCLLNNKAVQSMGNGIKNLREMSKKQELSLMIMENQHAKLMLNLETGQNNRAKNEDTLKRVLAQVKEQEEKLSKLEEKYSKIEFLLRRKQREVEIVVNKYLTTKEQFNDKTPQELRIEEYETHVKSMRERMYVLQHDWLRLQGHVVKLTEQHQKVSEDVNLTKKQLQICEQKNVYNQVECEKVTHDTTCVDRHLREMRSSLQMLENKRNEAQKRNNLIQLSNVSITQEYSVNLKGAEMQIFQLEDEIDAMDKDKINLTQELDRVQREALIWQRKGILAVELKKSMKEAKSAAGEIGLMKSEIQKMESRREQLRRSGDKLAGDLSRYVTRRSIAIDKTRAHAAVEDKHGSSHSQAQAAYHHKLRLAKSNVASATKQLRDAEARLKQLQEDQKRIEHGITRAMSENARAEEQVANLLREIRDTDRMKHWLLERVVRSQRLGSELAIVVRRQSLCIKKPKTTVLAEYTKAYALNDRLKYIVQRLNTEYPQIGDKLAIISNTLDIHSPSSALIFGPIQEVDENVPENLCQS